MIKLATHVFLIAMLAAVVATPLAKRLALRVGAVDKPVERSVHTEPKPYLGGLAIYAAFALAVLLTIGTQAPGIAGILVGGLFILVLGIVDDVFRLSPRIKLLGQIAAALILVAYGVRIDWLTNPLGGLIVLGRWSIPLTVLWIVAVVNVVNLVDGLDGLAAGISTIAAFTLMVVALGQGQAYVVFITAALAGSTLGFLPYNFNPAMIFMGDAGAMFLGYVLAAVAVEGTLKSATAIALVVPLLALGLPILDTAWAIIRRFINGQPIYQADRGHLHHRLLELGLSQRQAVLVMYLISGWLGLSAVILSKAATMLGTILLGLIFGLALVGARRAGLLEVRHSRNLRH